MAGLEPRLHAVGQVVREVGLSARSSNQVFVRSGDALDLERAVDVLDVLGRGFEQVRRDLLGLVPDLAGGHVMAEPPTAALRLP